MSRRSSGRAGLAGDAVARPGELDEARRSSPRRWRREMWRSGRVDDASEASRRCVATCGLRPCCQEGPSAAYGRQVAGHAAADGDCPN